MTQVIVYQNQEGGASVVYPAPYMDIQEVSKKDVPQGVSYKIMDVSELPDGNFQQAWIVSDIGITIDMPKARVVHKNNLRAARMLLMEVLDIEQLKAIENNDVLNMAQIKLKKQALRDITKDPRIEAAQTTEDLTGVWIAPED